VATAPDKMKQAQGVWKSARGKGRNRPKGRPLDDAALSEVQALLADKDRTPDLLIEHLHLIQDQYGHISAKHIRALAEEMRLSQAEVYEVATFYAHFDVVAEGETPPPALTIRVCDSLSCELAGAKQLQAALESDLDPSKVRVVRAPCMGRCDTAPTLELGHHHIDFATVERVQHAIAEDDTHAHIPAYQMLEDYLAQGGYQVIVQLRNGDRTADDIQDKLTVNGDEGEPGTFKDRYYLEREPHVFLEGLLIAAFAVDAHRAYIYMRDEYPAVLHILDEEIHSMETAGLIEPGYIEVRRGAGAYICGEESAMIESIEGKRGLPRHRPPYVAQKGLFNRPTLVHNVETLHWIARITREGPEILNSIEKNGRKGLRSFSVSGRVKKPGVKLLPAGSTITDIISAAGGMLDGHTFKAYQPGGPSSGILPASINDVPLDFDTLQAHGSFIGSAAVVVLSDKDKARDAALNMLRFFEDESCGQCTPCRVGCEKAVKLMEKEQWDTSLLEELCTVMVDASICGLGQAAPNPIRLVMKHFPEEI